MNGLKVYRGDPVATARRQSVTRWGDESAPVHSPQSTDIYIGPKEMNIYTLMLVVNIQYLVSTVSA